MWRTNKLKWENSTKQKVNDSNLELALVFHIQVSTIARVVTKWEDTLGIDSAKRKSWRMKKGDLILSNFNKVFREIFGQYSRKVKESWIGGGGQGGGRRYQKSQAYERG